MSHHKPTNVSDAAYKNAISYTTTTTTTTTTRKKQQKQGSTIHNSFSNLPIHTKCAIH
jgi:hypothetical protein